jgi:membrane protease YdiL (CAAX protease family)
VTAGGKLFLGGAILSAAGAGLTFARGGFPTSIAAGQANAASGPLAAGLALAALGCFVYVLQPAFNPDAARQVPFATIRTALAMLVVVVVVANALSLPIVAVHERVVGAAGPGERSLTPLGLTYLIAASEIPIVAVMWLRLVLPGCLSWRALGLRFQPFAAHVRTGLIGGASLFMAALIAGAVLSRFGIRQNQFERFEGIEGAPLPLFLLAAGAGSILAPLAEELFFRGYVFQTFERRYGGLWAYLFSAGLFAAVHANLAAAVPIFVLGLMLARIFQQSGSVVPGVIAHGVNNAISFALLYAGIRG